MKRLSFPLITFLVLCAGFLIIVNSTATLLPERVASHFGPAGQPDGWSTRSAFLTFMMLFGLGLPAFVIGLCSVCTLLPEWMINLPNKQYWLSPELRNQTRLYLIAQGLWLGCLMLLLMTAMYYLTIQANRAVPVHLPTNSFVTVMGGFVLGIGAWTFNLVRHFRRA